MSTGTKNFFHKVGDTLTFKKSDPPQKTSTPVNPWFKPPKEQPKPSWFTSQEEPKKPNSPSEWLEQKRLDP
jgi:hypothetical protein